MINWSNGNFQLAFDPEADHATLSYTAKESGVVSCCVGLDNVYRFNEPGIGTFAAFGFWTSPKTFEISCQEIGYSNPTWSWTFKKCGHSGQMGMTREYK